MDGTQHKASPMPVSSTQKPHHTSSPPDGLDTAASPGQGNCRFLDRELSWLKFNERVLELAEDPTLPLLERANFLAIFATNLDEFFMVRVAGLKRLIDTRIPLPSAGGLSPQDLIGTIYREAYRLQERHAKVFSEQIRPALAGENIRFVAWNDLGKDEKDVLRAIFRDKIFPILTPLAVDPAHPFPYISGLSMNLAILIRDPFKNKELFARVKVPSQLERFINIESYAPSAGPAKTVRFISVEQVIMHHLDELFPGMEILERHTFRMTRNEDLELEEDEAQDLLETMEKELMRRRFGSPVRLEIATDISPRIRALLIRELEIEEQEVYDLPAPLDLRGLSTLTDLDRPALRHPRHKGATNYHLRGDGGDSATNIFAAMRRRDILLHHPYDSFSTSVLLFLEQAATDTRVRAIKQTLYRTSGNSPIVDALVRAAENGKQVLALVEIKARFDEQANIAWARTLEHAGVHVVYGIVGLKTHAKLSLVVRQEADGLRRYCHLGTGNYHPSTARTYEDYGLLTSDPQVGEDLNVLFNQLSGYAIKTNFKRLLVAPHDVRTGLIELIEQEIRNKKAGREAKIQIKVNSLVDEALTDALYRASQAGVEIEMVIRGPCTLRPDVAQLSENIRVYSVLGRFLEHSRIFVFHNAGNPQVYIGSADMMHRNLDHRIEVLVLLKNKEDGERLIGVLNKYVSPETSYWTLDSAGNWNRNGLSSEREDIQQWFIGIHQQPHGEDNIVPRQS